MGVSLGINPITWTNDDAPELGGDIPLEVCLSEARAAGYAGIELGGKFPRRASLLGPILEAAELALVSGWFDGRCAERSIGAEMQAIGPHLELLADLGCRHVVYADTSYGRNGAIYEPISRRPRLPEGEWQAYGEKLTRLAERMQQDFGVGMAFHHHMGTIIETDGEVDRLMHHTGPAVGLLLDTGHSAFAGGDPLALARRHIARIVHVHAKDVRPAVLERARRDDMSFMGAVLEGIFTVPGDGGIDFLPLLRLLADYGYSGWIVVEAEQDPAKAHPLTYARLGHDHLTELLAASGLQKAA